MIKQPSSLTIEPVRINGNGLCSLEQGEKQEKYKGG